MLKLTSSSNLTTQALRWRTLGLILVLASVLAACGTSDPATNPEADAVTTEFVGQTEGGSASVVFAKTDDKLIAYICNNTDTAEWFDAASGPDLKELSAKTGARIILSSANEFAEGMFIAADGTEHKFNTSTAVGDQGLYLLSGDEAVDPASAISLEEIINNAMVQLIKAQLGISETSKFRAGWIVSDNDFIVGNVTVERVGVAPLGNKLPFAKEVLTGTTLSVRRRPANSGSVTSSNGCDPSEAGFTCQKAIERNAVLAAISNILTANDLESDFVDNGLNECAETLTDFCA